MPLREPSHEHRASRALSGAFRRMFLGLGVLVAVCFIGVFGYLIAGWRLDDALFMVVITIFGVGYSEVRPVDTGGLRALTGFVIIAGYGSVIYAVGGFIQMVVDGELNKAFGARRMSKEVDRLENHTIICGFGRMGTSLGRELRAAGKPFVAIDMNPDAIERAELEGYLIINGDAAEELVLERAGIARASFVASVLSNDATNVFVTLTARSLNAKIKIFARGDNRNTESKLINCGADQVVMPTDIGATKISQLIARPTAQEMIDRMTSSADVDLVHLGLEFDEIELDASSPWVDRTLGEVEVRGAHGYLVVGVRAVDGTITMHPSVDVRLGVGDRVIVLGYHDDIPTLAARAKSETTTIAG